jgi:hypothetical protein
MKPKWPLDRGEVSLAISDVELDRQDGVAVRLDQIGQGAGVAGGGGDLVTTLQGADRPFPAEAT